MLGDDSAFILGIGRRIDPGLERHHILHFGVFPRAVTTRVRRPVLILCADLDWGVVYDDRASEATCSERAAGLPENAVQPKIT